MDTYEVIVLHDALEFLQGLPVKMRAKAFRTIELLEEFGPQLPMPHARTMKGTGGIHELRVRQAKDIVRLFYFHHKGQVFVVTSGFAKKTDKTDPRELRRAIDIMNSYKEQN